MNDLAGKRLRYLIGADEDAIKGEPGAITMVPYGAPRVLEGTSAGYCNAFDQEGNRAYPPYRGRTDTASDYGEDVPDDGGPGWMRLLNSQFSKRRKQVFDLIEIDNIDAYQIAAVLAGVSLAQEFGLRVLAKNPTLRSWPEGVELLRHPNVVGAIMEHDANPLMVLQMCTEAGRPDLPLWFVAHGREEHAWVIAIARKAEVTRGLAHIGATWSRESGEREYAESIDIFPPSPSR